jgi:hypothetical protein
MVQLELNSNFLVVFLALPRIPTMASITHIPTSNNLVATNERQLQIEQTFFFFSCHRKC